MAPTLTSEAWTQIRFDYEHSERPIAAICAEHGISSGTLRDRMRRWGWTRRRPPIPREGPPSLPAPVVEMRTVASVVPLLPAVREFDVEGVPALDEGSPHPAASRSQVYAGCVNLPAALSGDPPPPGEGEGGEAAAEAGTACEAARGAAAVLQIAGGEDAAAPSESDDTALVPRLQGAVARVLPAIEAIVGRLAAGAMHPREMERAGRALGVLTRTLRELNGLLGERRPPVPAAEPAGKPAENDDGGPQDMEEFRQELIRRMNAIIAAREDNAEGGVPAAGDAGGDAGGAAGPVHSPCDAESECAAGSGRTAELSRLRPPGPQVRSL